MSQQLNMFEYADKQAVIKSTIEKIHYLACGQEINLSTISIRRTDRFFETLQIDVFHECFREVDECVQFLKVYLETGKFLK
ncbi:hypothetical protein ACWV26_06130 [Rummeliibacillus sp. JY-2-4R]